MRTLLDDDRFKLQFTGHETFPIRYGWLKKSYDEVVRVGAEPGGDTNSVFTDEAAIGFFGVGKNMVTSMRHWALAAGVLSISELEAGARQGRILPTAFGDLLFGPGGDTYLEQPASLWLLHWQLAARPGRSTTWHWAFNELNEPAMDRDLLTSRLQRRVSSLRDAGRLKEARLTETTLRRDVECFVRTYLARTGAGRGAQEDSIESPLFELSLLQPVGVGGAFSFRRGPKPTLSDEVFLFALLTFWRMFHPTRREFSVEAITHEPGGPGRVFLLDEESVADRLACLADLTGGSIRWDESSGIRQVYAHDLERLNPMSVAGRAFGRPPRLAA